MPPRKLSEIFQKKMVDRGLVNPGWPLGPVAQLLCEAIETKIQEELAWRKELARDASED